MTNYDHLIKVECDIYSKSGKKEFDCTVFRDEKWYALKHGSMRASKRRIFRNIDKIMVDESVGTAKFDESGVLKIQIFPKNGECQLYDEIETRTQKNITVLDC